MVSNVSCMRLQHLVGCAGGGQYSPPLVFLRGGGGVSPWQPPKEHRERFYFSCGATAAVTCLQTPLGMTLGRLDLPAMENASTRRSLAEMCVSIYPLTSVLKPHEQRRAWRCDGFWYWDGAPKGGMIWQLSLDPAPGGRGMAYDSETNHVSGNAFAVAWEREGM